MHSRPHLSPDTVMVVGLEVRNALGATLVTMSLSREKVLVTAKPHPASKALRTIGQEVVGGAEARPNGFGNLERQRISRR